MGLLHQTEVLLVKTAVPLRDFRSRFASESGVLPNAKNSRTSAFSWDTFKTMLAAGGAAGFCGGAATTLALGMRGVRSALSDRAMIVTIGICCPALLAAPFTRLSLAPPGPRVRVTPALGE